MNWMCMWSNLGSCWKLTQQVWNGACRMWPKMTKLSEVSHFILSKQRLEKQAAIDLRVLLPLLLTRVWQQSCPKEAPNPVSWKSSSNSCLTLYPVNMFPSGPYKPATVVWKSPSQVRGQCKTSYLEYIRSIALLWSLGLKVSWATTNSDWETV